jgi:hypothetical protein
VTLDRHRVYKRVETDDEFRARVPGQVIMVETKRKVTSWYGFVHEETAREPVRVRDLSGEQLDDAVWNALKMQRRVVEDTTDPSDRRTTP